MEKANFLSLLLITLIIGLVSCNPKKKLLSHEQMVKNYYNAVNNGDFNTISGYVSDSVITAEMEYILTRDKKELYRQFRWDSVFTPKYNLIELKEDSNSIVATVSKICQRIKFLQDSALIYKEKIEFNGNRIVKIHLTDYVHLNFVKWQPRRDSLTAWIDSNHPELSGFVYDLSLKGAQNYLKAIDLYKNRK